MKNSFFLAAFICLSLPAFSQDIINDKNAEKRIVSGFHGIGIEGGIDLYFSQGEDAVAVSAVETSDRDHIVTEVKDGILRIYMDKNGWKNAHGDRKLKAYVSCKVLDLLEASGGSDVYIKEVMKGEKLNLNISGGSDLRGKLDLQSLSITQSGGSDSYISGSVSNFALEASGGSDFHGYELLADEGTVKASGGSDVQITARKGLTISASGGSDVFYKGTAVLRGRQSSGSSSITKKS